MLRITVPGAEYYNDLTNEFVSTKDQTLDLEHSLVSLSKWESKWCKPFLSGKPITNEEFIDYIRCMTITKNVDPDVYKCLTKENINDVNEYLKSPMTATTFTQKPSGKSSSEIPTSELIYYWMITAGVPFECEKWHLNRLLTLIRVCNVKEQGGKKMSKRDVLSQNAALNAARRKPHMHGR